MKNNKKAKKRSAKRATPKSPNHDRAVRQHVKDVLTWSDAHVDWKKSLAGLPAEKRRIRPEGLPHSAWELLEHARISQEDIVDFCTNANYKAMEWPKDYWPKTQAPPDDSAWENAIKALRRGTEAMVKLVENPRVDLYAKIRHGSGQTILREALLLADHNAYHVGQLVLVRRLLGTWHEG